MLIRSSGILVMVALLLGCGEWGPDGQWANTNMEHRMIRDIVANQLAVNPKNIDRRLPLSAQRFKAEDGDVVAILFEMEKQLEVEITDGAIKQVAGSEDIPSLADTMSIDGLYQVFLLSKEMAEASKK